MTDYSVKCKLSYNDFYILDPLPLAGKLSTELVDGNEAIPSLVVCDALFFCCCFLVVEVFVEGGGVVVIFVVVLLSTFVCVERWW